MFHLIQDMYINVSVCIYIRIDTHTHIHECIYMQEIIYMCLCIYTSIVFTRYASIQICRITYIHEYIYSYIHV